MQKVKKNENKKSKPTKKELKKQERISRTIQCLKECSVEKKKKILVKIKENIKEDKMYIKIIEDELNKTDLR